MDLRAHSTGGQVDGVEVAAVLAERVDHGLRDDRRPGHALQSPVPAHAVAVDRQPADAVAAGHHDDMRGPGGPAEPCAAVEGVDVAADATEAVRQQVDSAALAGDHD